MEIFLQILEAKSDHLSMRTYNVAAMSFSPEEIANAIKRRIPKFEIEYEICPYRQKIADSWPDSLDDSMARKDWAWHNDYDIDSMVDTMLKLIREQHGMKTVKNLSVNQ